MTEAQTMPAEACLTLDQLEDTQLVSIVKSVGAPPPYLAAKRHFGQEHKDWVTTFLHELPSPTMAARIIGCSLSTLFHHKKVDPAFKAAWQDAMEASYDTLMGAASEEALGIGVRHVVTKDGDVLTIPKERNDKILTAFINFRLGQKITHEGIGANLPPDAMYIVVTPDQLGKLTKDERHELTRILAKLEQLAPKTVSHAEALPA